MTPKSSQILHWSRASKLRCARESTWRALPRMVRAWKVAVRANSWFHTVSWHYSQQKSAWTRWRNAPCTGKNRFAAWRSTELACSRNDQTLTWSNPPLPSAKCWQWKGVDRVHPSKQTKPASLFACFPGPKPFEIAEIATLSIAMSSPDRSIARITTPAENTTETRPMTTFWISSTAFSPNSWATTRPWHTFFEYVSICLNHICSCSFQAIFLKCRLKREGKHDNLVVFVATAASTKKPLRHTSADMSHILAPTLSPEVSMPISNSSLPLVNPSQFTSHEFLVWFLPVWFLWFPNSYEFTAFYSISIPNVLTLRSQHPPGLRKIAKAWIHLQQKLHTSKHFCGS